MKKVIGLMIQQEVKANYEAGLSTHKIGEQLNISPSSVFRILRRLGIKLRGRYDYEYGKYIFKRDFFEEINNPKSAYWLGVLLADGYIDGKYKVRLSVSSQDKDWLQLFVNDLMADIPIRFFSSHKLNDIAYFQINNKGMVRDLAKYGIVQGKTGIELFPDIPSVFYSDFIRGVFDGDGSAGFYKDGRNSWQPHFTLCGSESLLKSIKIILRKYCDVKDNKIAQRGMIYTLGFAGFNQVRRIYSFIYPNNNTRCLLRKRRVFDDAFVIRKQ